mmetsp:Transcript_10906/g.22718  ORF Transcript_10906/g.22718 Transcript_10906/m.22718 type:complete len:86 (-) Transcript_10906:64-321(-)
MFGAMLHYWKNAQDIFTGTAQITQSGLRAMYLFYTCYFTCVGQAAIATNIFVTRRNVGWPKLRFKMESFRFSLFRFHSYLHYSAF